jgi:uncharacterized protein (UPF0332 family)|uniref:HEPN domain-containing protein n=1 Tax=Desulfobacca acetoxidans TaxID=60893 RepID=A0A7V6DP63_9BACT
MTVAEEISLMLAKARRYLASAETLRREQDFDSAMSRLYYAMFYAAEALLLAQGHTFSSHRAVISAFGKLLVKKGIVPKELHQWLHEAFDKRQLSDYEFLTGIGDEEVAAMQPKAAQFLEQATRTLRQWGVLGECS